MNVNEKIMCPTFNFALSACFQSTDDQEQDESLGILIWTGAM